MHGPSHWGRPLLGLARRASVFVFAKTNEEIGDRPFYVSGIMGSVSREV